MPQYYLGVPENDQKCWVTVEGPIIEIVLVWRNVYFRLVCWDKTLSFPIHFDEIEHMCVVGLTLSR
jgi:hypothetical protein